MLDAIRLLVTVSVLLRSIDGETGKDAVSVRTLENGIATHSCVVVLVVVDVISNLIARQQSGQTRIDCVRARAGRRMPPVLCSNDRQ